MYNVNEFPKNKQIQNQRTYWKPSQGHNYNNSII